MKNIQKFCLFPFLFFALTLHSQSGNLDTTFANNGLFKAKTISPCYGRDVAIQQDGKIIVIGDCYDYQFNMIRLDHDGNIDSSFGHNGVVETDISNYNDVAYAIAIQSDGKIILGGTSRNYMDFNFALARYNSDGTLDQSFGNNGIVVTDIDSTDKIYDLALQDDGKIIAAGYTFDEFDEDFAIIRYNTDGTIDQTFGDNGIFVFNNPDRDDVINSVAIQQDGKIVAGGNTVTTGLSDKDHLIVRIMPNGNIDNSFGTNGKVTPEQKDWTTLNSLAVQQDGKIIFVGELYKFNSHILVARYNIDGTADSSFGTKGFIDTGITDHRNYATSLLIQPDNKILIGGHFRKTSDQDIAILRYNFDGTPDNSFGTGGISTANFSPTSEFIYSMAFQKDGKIIIVGNLLLGSEYYYSAIRFLTGITIGITEIENKQGVSLYPNPTYGNSTIKYILSERNIVSIYLTDLSGKIVKKFIENKRQVAGNYKQELIPPKNITTGYYLVILKTSNKMIAIKILIL